MPNITRVATNVAASGLAAALAVAAWTLPACPQTEGSALQMRCWWTSRAELLLSSAVLVWALAFWFIRRPAARSVAGGALVLLNLVVLAVPRKWVIGVCANPHMACHRLAFWLEVFAGGIGGLIARYLPGVDEAPQVMRNAYNNWCRNQAVPWVGAAQGDYAAQEVDGGCGQLRARTPPR